MDNLIFNRQFIMGGKLTERLEGWNEYEVCKGIYVTSHPNLEIEIDRNMNQTVIMIGYILDPKKPEYTNKMIVRELNHNSNDFFEFKKNTYSLSGRWVLIYVKENEIKILNDPNSLRSIFFIKKNNKTWLGSQPEILKYFIETESRYESELLDYKNSSFFKKNENNWYGNETVYKDIYHLLPNHYLDYNSGEIRRFFVNQVEELSLNETIENVSNLLKGTIKAMNLREKLMIGVTAGWDSRVIVAATKSIKDEVYYYVSKMNMSESDNDIRIPKILFSKEHLKLNILDTKEPVRDEIKLLLSNNVTLSRILPKTRTIQYLLDNFDGYVNVNGNASGIAKNVYGIDNPSIDKINGKYILNKAGFYKDFKYVEEQINLWLDELRESKIAENIPVMDLFYWEQRMGNWGSLYQAEQDIAIDELMPFNNREIIMNLLNVDEKLRLEPDYIIYEKLIEFMWPELMSEPVNPSTRLNKIYSTVRKLIPQKIKKFLRNIFDR